MGRDTGEAKVIPIVRPFHPALSEFDTYFRDILKSGLVTNNGTYVRQFEEELSKILGVPTLAFSSGMAALIAMLRAVDVEGMEVICPSFTFPATPNAIVLAGAKPVFADINPDTLCLDAEDVERQINHHTVAVLGVDVFGVLWEPPTHWGDEIDILIDAAPSFGSVLNGGLAANRGKAQIYSFHATKCLSTMEGGALCSNDPELLEKARRIRNFGQDYEGNVTEFGFNGKMMEVCALIGLKQLETFDFRIASRLSSATYLRASLDGIEGLRVYRAPVGQQPVWTYQPVFIEPEFGPSRDDVVEKLKAKGIGVRVYYPACHLLQAYSPMSKHMLGFTRAGSNPIARLSVTRRLASQVISLPIFDEMLDSEIEQIKNAFVDIRNGK